MSKYQADYVICGAGIVGLTIAHRLLEMGKKNILILEKEFRVGCHASGKNSGVLHAGIYYSPGTLKARLCLEGNFLMRDYCKKHSLPLIESGKVLVCKNEEEKKVLELLYERAKENGAKVSLLDTRELKKIEPMAKTYQKALFSSYTAIIDPQSILQTLEREIIASNRAQILYNTSFEELIEPGEIRTSNGSISFGFFINASGSFSDRIAHSFGLGLDYRVLPFKGIYKRLVSSHWVRGNIYPVPNLENPFLGVHLTRNIHGEVYAGPTATPALGRENYGIFSGLELESFWILYRNVFLFLCNPKFRTTALQESQKYFPHNFLKDLKSLVPDLRREDLENCDKVGIRPQLVDWKKKELLSDFMVLRDQKSLHILNAISPAFTSSFAFARFLLDKHAI